MIGCKEYIIKKIHDLYSINLKIYYCLNNNKWKFYSDIHIVSSFLYKNNDNKTLSNKRNSFKLYADFYPML